MSANEVEQTTAAEIEDAFIELSPFSKHNLNALSLTCLGALGTAVGGLLVVLQPEVSFVRLGALQVRIATNPIHAYSPVKLSLRVQIQIRTPVA